MTTSMVNFISRTQKHQTHTHIHTDTIQSKCRNHHHHQQPTTSKQKQKSHMMIGGIGGRSNQTKPNLKQKNINNSIQCSSVQMLNVRLFKQARIHFRIKMKNRTQTEIKTKSEPGIGKNHSSNKTGRRIFTEKNKIKRKWK